MAVARGLVEELFVGQSQDGPVTVALERDRHQRLAFRRRMPRPREDETFVRHHLAIDAADVVPLAAGAAHDETESSPDTHVGLDVHRVVDLPRPPPAFYLLRIRPGGVDLRRRRVESPPDGE